MKKCVYGSHDFSKEHPPSKEHIIPEFLGGFWWERFACSKCNSELGSATDAEWQRNHEVIRALTQLEMPIDPNVFRQTRKPPTDPNEKPKYELVGYPKTKAPFTKAPFFVDRQSGVVNIDSNFAEDRERGALAISGIIQTDYGVSKGEATQIAKEAIEQLVRLAPGQTARIEKTFPTGKLIISSSPIEVEGTVNMLDHFKPTIPVRSVVKIAYGFAAVLLKDDILCGEYERFRKFLMIPDSGEKIRALALDTVWENLKPIHVLGVRARHGKLYVVVILFHCMGFVIELGPAKYVTDAQCLFNIKQKTAELCHFAPESEAALDEILEKEFMGEAS